MKRTLEGDGPIGRFEVLFPVSWIMIMLIVIIFIIIISNKH